MNRLSLQQQLIIGVVIVVVILVGFFFIVWRPQNDAVATLAMQAEAENKKTQEAINTLARLKEAKAESAQIEKELVHLNEQMPIEAQIASLLVDLQDMANESGVDLVSITPSDPTPLQRFSEIQMQLGISSTFFDLVDFLYRLETMPRIAKVTRLSIQGGTSYPELSSTLAISVYMLGKPGMQGGVPGAPAAGAPGGGKAPASPGQ